MINFVWKKITFFQHYFKTVSYYFTLTHSLKITSNTDMTDHWAAYPIYVSIFNGSTDRLYPSSSSILLISNKKNNF